MSFLTYNHNLIDRMSDDNIIKFETHSPKTYNI